MMCREAVGTQAGLKPLGPGPGPGPGPGCPGLRDKPGHPFRAWALHGLESQLCSYSLRNIFEQIIFFPCFLSVEMTWQGGGRVGMGSCPPVCLPPQLQWGSRRAAKGRWLHEPGLGGQWALLGQAGSNVPP